MLISKIWQICLIFILLKMNGKITEVKQPQDQPYSKMGDHLGSTHFVFFSVAEI